MRPTNPLSHELPGRSRKGSIEGLQPAQAAPSGPTIFFLATESDLARRGSTTIHDTTSISPSKDSRTGRSRDAEPKSSKTLARTPPARPTSHRRSTLKPRSVEELRVEALRQLQQQHQQNATSSEASAGFLTPSLPASQNPSLPDSPKSLSPRSLSKLDEPYGNDGASSHAIESSDDEEQDDAQPRSTESLDNSAPQLIMPSIRMPSRRPFTERGKQIDRFKIMVVGSKGRTSCGRSNTNVPLTRKQVLARHHSSNQSCNCARISSMSTLWQAIMHRCRGPELQRMQMPSTRHTLVHGRIPAGGLKWTRVVFSGGEKVWVI